MSITELCAAIGPENILIQPLNEAVTNVTQRKKLGGYQVAFITNQFTCNDFLGIKDDSKVGLILWIPKTHIDRINAVPRDCYSVIAQKKQKKQTKTKKETYDESKIGR